MYFATIKIFFIGSQLRAGVRGFKARLKFPHSQCLRLQLKVRNKANREIMSVTGSRARKGHRRYGSFQESWCPEMLECQPRHRAAHCA